MYTGKDELINCRSQEWQKMYKKHAHWNAYFSFDRRSLNFLTSKKLHFLGFRVNLASVFKFALRKNSARTSKLKQVVVNYIFTKERWMCLSQYPISSPNLVLCLCTDSFQSLFITSLLWKIQSCFCRLRRAHIAEGTALYSQVLFCINWRSRLRRSRGSGLISLPTALQQLSHSCPAGPSRDFLPRCSQTTAVWLF